MGREPWEEFDDRAAGLNRRKSFNFLRKLLALFAN